MLTLPPSVRIFLAAESVDMRRGHDGLCAIVRNQWKLDLFGGHLFVSVGRRGDRCKILFWDRGGFVLYYKRLEKGCFRVPRVAPGASSVVMDGTELAMLLEHDRRVLVVGTRPGPSLQFLEFACGTLSWR